MVSGINKIKKDDESFPVKLVLEGPSFGLHVRNLRKKANLTLSKLSDASGMSISAISKIENSQKRVNIKKLVDLSDLVNKTYENVSIELSDKKMFKELNELLNQAGETKIHVVFRENSKNYKFELGQARKLDFNLFSLIKNKEYVKKISF